MGTRLTRLANPSESAIARDIDTIDCVKTMSPLGPSSPTRGSQSAARVEAGQGKAGCLLGLSPGVTTVSRASNPQKLQWQLDKIVSKFYKENFMNFKNTGQNIFSNLI